MAFPLNKYITNYCNDAINQSCGWWKALVSSTQDSNQLQFMFFSLYKLFPLIGDGVSCTLCTSSLFNVLLSRDNNLEKNDWSDLLLRLLYVPRSLPLQ